MKKKAILISCFGNSKGRLKIVNEILEDEYEVTMVLSDYSHINKARITEKSYGCEYIHVPAYKKNLSIQRVISHFYFGIKVNKYINEIQPDLIYLLLPPNNVAMYCANYKKKHKQMKLYMDVIDLWPESFPINFISRTFIYRIWKQMRDNALCYANHIFTECDLYKKTFLDLGIEMNKINTLRLFKDKSVEEWDDVHKSISEYIKDKECLKTSDYIKLGYLGSINYIIDINNICAVIEALKECGYKVQLHIIGVGESKDELINQSEKCGAEVIYYGKIFEEKKKCEILGQCDFGLNIMKDSVSVGLTTKSVDYFSMGIPIINTIKGDTWNLVEKEKIGINYNENKQEFIEMIQTYDFLSRKQVLDCFEKNFSKDKFVSEISKYIKEAEK